ncbi:MAG: sugar phosphate isomerase/epimerase family protein [Acidobacteriota bacterium]
MYVCLNSVTIQGRVKWPEFAHLAHRTGYAGVDPNMGKIMAEGVDSTRSFFRELHLKPSALDFPVVFNKDDAAFESSLKNLEPAAQFARAIGCPRMLTWIMSSTGRPKDEQRKIYKDRFTTAARILARSGVRLGLEFLGPLHIRKSAKYEFIWRMDEMTEFAKECGPNVGLLLDAWHWHHAGATPGDIVKAGKDRIVHVHLADAPDLPPEQIRDDARLVPGEGVVNWKGFFGALKEIGYKDGLSPEIFGRLKDKTPEDAARIALEGSLKVMRESGITKQS